MRGAHDIAGQPLPPITYVPRGDAVPETEVAALANVYRLILDSARQGGHIPNKSIADNTILPNTKEVSRVVQQPG